LNLNCLSDSRKSEDHDKYIHHIMTSNFSLAHTREVTTAVSKVV